MNVLALIAIGVIIYFAMTTSKNSRESGANAVIILPLVLVGVLLLSAMSGASIEMILSLVGLAIVGFVVWVMSDNANKDND